MIRYSVPKGRVMSWVQEPKRYEFPAIELLHQDAVTLPRFAAVYFHSKGVSYENDKHARWRDVLNTGVLAHWWEHHHAVSTGVDISGINYLSEPKKYKPHFSGNFWFADSQYVSTLKDPTTLDQADRFEAENWLGSQKHRACTRPFWNPTGWVKPAEQKESTDLS